ncbi:hypothetical protein BDW02DRAFT_420978 [Decorospora gaudefroyi]|uniref:RING-type domain-containing protein n=1 Tax=Decorospora gaudefroyi TaxID=184978 RepID=A0A6A5K805_9PLEO|nr:hypothetical protein BDW02DRAFT_420978 [Decorospora gaudefroyi]
MNSTIEALLYTLKHHYTFPQLPTETTDPYLEAMHTFQAFTTHLIATLGSPPYTRDLTRVTVNGVLQDIYTGFPSFHDQDKFHVWVKDGVLKPPLRRTAKQFQFQGIVRLQKASKGTINTLMNIIFSAVVIATEWEERVCKPEDVVHDPSPLYFFTKNHAAKTISLGDGVEHEPDCPICTETFDPPVCIPQRALCGHVLCHGCFQKWLRQSSATYTCPLCRACIVCGIASCPHHTIGDTDRAPPLPLPEILNQILPETSTEVLHGIVPRRYWELREVTRKDRGTLAWIEHVLAMHNPAQDDPVRVRLTKDSVEIVESITEEVKKVVRP